MVTSPAYEGCWLLRPGRAGRQHCLSSRILYSLSVTYFFFFKNDITDSPGNGKKLIPLDSQSEIPASCTDTADPSTTFIFFYSPLKKVKSNSNCKYADMQAFHGKERK